MDKKFDILDDFAPRFGNVELEVGSNCECTRIRGRNLNIQLVMGFDNDLIFI